MIKAEESIIKEHSQMTGLLPVSKNEPLVKQEPLSIIEELIKDEPLEPNTQNWPYPHEDFVAKNEPITKQEHIEEIEESMSLAANNQNWPNPHEDFIKWEAQEIEHIKEEYLPAVIL